MRDLLRAVAKTAGGSAAALLMGMATAKVLATLIGPSGVGAYSLLRQTQQTAILLTLLNGQAALIQGIASRVKEEDRQRYITVVFWIVLAVAAVMSLLFVAAPGQVARLLIGRGHQEATEMIRFLSLSVIFGAASYFSIGVLNGHRMIGRGSLVVVMNHFVIAALSYPAALLVLRGTPTALSWLLNAGAIGGAALGFVLVWRARVLKAMPLPRWNAEERAAARHFLTIASSMIVSAAMSYGVPLVIRAMVVRTFDFAGTGIFDVAWTLSMSYVLIVVTAFSSYYLPTLSALDDPAERIALMRRVLRLTVLLLLPLVTTVIVLKPLVISILYTEQFVPALRIMRWALIGDYFKVLSWVFAYTMLAYADMKTFLTTEVIWGSLTLAGAYVGLRRFHSLESIGVVLMTLSMLYLIVMARYVQQRHAFSLLQNGVWGVLIGLMVIVAASIATWNDEVVRWPVAIVCIAAAGLVSWMLLTRAERQRVHEHLRFRIRGTPQDGAR